jgi:hypothetical protein
VHVEGMGCVLRGWGASCGRSAMTGRVSCTE